MTKNLPLILASGSKGRLLLLNNAGFTLDKVVTVDIDESCKPRENPKHYAQRVACEKMQAASLLVNNAIVITADTTAVCGGRILHKTENDELLRKYWQLTSGRRHRVYTAVYCARIEDGVISCIKHKVTLSIVQFRRLSNDEIEHYIESREGYNKAGGCSIMGIAGRYIKFIRGSYSAVIGLPICETTQLLSAVGYNVLRRG